MMNLEMMIAEGKAVFSNCYGVKAEKAKARKSRKAKRLESRKHKHTGFNRNPDKDADRYGRILVQNREKTLFKENLRNVIADAEAEYAEYLATEKAKAEVKAEAERVASLTEEQKAEKRNIIKNALVKSGLNINSVFQTKRGRFDFGYYWDDEAYSEHPIGYGLIKIEEKSCPTVYIIWQNGDSYTERKSISPRSVEEMIEDMVKII